VQGTDQKEKSTLCKGLTIKENQHKWIGIFSTANPKNIPPNQYQTADKFLKSYLSLG
jgi:hypothetical protein